MSKLSQMTKAREQEEEHKHLNQVLFSARKQQKIEIEKNYPLPPVLNEESLFSSVLQSYQSRDLNGFEYYSRIFLNKFPHSVFADNTVYLGGQLKLLIGLPGEALRDFEKVLIQYPTGNKRAAALLGKGIAYKKLELKDYARKVFSEIQQKYPGSPEYYKVELEEKLLSVE